MNEVWGGEGGLFNPGRITGYVLVDTAVSHLLSIIDFVLESFVAVLCRTIQVGTAFSDVVPFPNRASFDWWSDLSTSLFSIGEGSLTA